MHHSVAGNQVRSIAKLGTKGTIDSGLALTRPHIPSREDFLQGRIVGRAVYTFSGNQSAYSEMVQVVRLDDEGLDLVDMDLTAVIGEQP